MDYEIPDCLNFEINAEYHAVVFQYAEWTFGPKLQIGTCPQHTELTNEMKEENARAIMEPTIVADGAHEDESLIERVLRTVFGRKVAPIGRLASMPLVTSYRVLRFLVSTPFALIRIYISTAFRTLTWPYRKIRDFKNRSKSSFNGGIHIGKTQTSDQQPYSQTNLRAKDSERINPTDDASGALQRMDHHRSRPPDTNTTLIVTSDDVTSQLTEEPMPIGDTEQTNLDPEVKEQQRPKTNDHYNCQDHRLNWKKVIHTTTSAGPSHQQSNIRDHLTTMASDDDGLIRDLNQTVFVEKRLDFDDTNKSSKSDVKIPDDQSKCDSNYSSSKGQSLNDRQWEDIMEGHSNATVTEQLASLINEDNTPACQQMASLNRLLRTFENNMEMRDSAGVSVHTEKVVLHDTCLSNKTSKDSAKDRLFGHKLDEPAVSNLTTETLLVDEKDLTRQSTPDDVVSHNAKDEICSSCRNKKNKKEQEIENVEAIRRELLRILRKHRLKLEESLSIDKVIHHLEQILDHENQAKEKETLRQEDEKPPPAGALGIDKVEDLAKLSVREIRQILTDNSVDFEGCFEKSDLVVKITQLWKDLNKNSGVVPDGDRCLICMDSRIDCVFLECGHMATCHECGQVIKDCPICRIYVSRVVRTYRP